MSQVYSNNATRGSAIRHAVNNEPAFEIMDLVYALFRWRWFIIFFTIISAILSFLATTARDLEYQAVTSVLINPLGINVIEGDINARTESPDVNIALIESQMRIMESRPVLNQTIKNLNNPDWVASTGVFDLMNDPEFTGTGRGLKSKFLNLVGLEQKASETDLKLSVLSRMRESIAVYRPQLGYVVELNYKSDNPKKAAIIANAIAETYLELESESNAGQAQKAADDLNRQLQKLRDDLLNAEILVEDHKRDKGIVSAAGGLANELEFTQVQQDLIEARNAAAAAKITLETVNALKESGTLPQNLPEAITSSSIANLRTQLSQVKQRQISLSAQYLPTHPVMRAAQLAVDDAENSVRAEISLIAEAAEVEYNNALRTENELEQEVSSLTNESFSTNDDLIKLRDLQRDAEAKKAVFEAFLLRAGELGQQADVDTNKAEIVSPASEPQAPIDLPGTILVAGGTMFGFIVSCALVLIGTGAATLGRSMNEYGEKRLTKRSGDRSPRGTERQDQMPARRGKLRDRSGSGSLFRNIFNPDNELQEKRTKKQSVKDGKTAVGKRSKQKGKQSSVPLNLPVLHMMEVDRGYLIGERIPFLEDSEPGERISDLVEEMLSFSSGSSTRKVLVTGIEASYGKSILASNLALAASRLGYMSALIGMDSENKVSLQDFAAKMDDSTQDAEGSFKYFRIKHIDQTNEFQANVELVKLKEHLGSKMKRYDIAFFDGPLLDDENQLEKVAEMVDEVIIAMPKNTTEKVKAGIFRKLGSRAKRIRGLVTTHFYTN